ncbi:MAG: trypsin-like peptidase domain-containing protein [Deferribacteres bacterium]|nr:trypsin-like peptidase domain-containing protein [candidate division KSB1 bacterium]MCB9503417.1 trypsin-like peptidase domain-containing protein [Deferribacteres bacterium]
MLKPKYYFVIGLFFIAQSYVLSQSILVDLDAEINQIVEQIKPSVVTISAVIPQDDQEQSFFSFLSGPAPADSNDTLKHSITNIGTGIVLHEKGYVVTKSSVVDGAAYIYVQFEKDTNYLAELIGIDQQKSIALLRIENPDLVPLNIGDPDLLRAGSWTVLVGNSLGIASSVSLGNVNLVYPDGLLQIALNTAPGNNGSPVMNSTGQVIGMVSGRLTISNSKMPNGSAGGMECALVTPIGQILDACIRIQDVYLENHGWIGITVRPHENKWPQIVTVFEDSPAAKAGLKVGDVLTKVDTMALRDYFDLKNIMQTVKPGKEMTVHILRNDKPYKIDLKTSRIGGVPDFSALKQQEITKLEPRELKKFERFKPQQYEQRMLMMERQIQSLQNQLNKIK